MYLLCYLSSSPRHCSQHDSQSISLLLQTLYCKERLSSPSHVRQCEDLQGCCIDGEDHNGDVSSHQPLHPQTSIVHMWTYNGRLRSSTRKILCVRIPNISWESHACANIPGRFFPPLQKNCLGTRLIIR